MQADTGEDQFLDGVDDKEEPDAEGDVEWHQVGQAQYGEIEANGYTDQTLMQDQITVDENLLEGFVIVIERIPGVQKQWDQKADPHQMAQKEPAQARSLIGVSEHVQR